MLTSLGIILLSLAGITAADSSAAADAGGRPGRTAPESDEILWLARCIYSESDRSDEQRLVAWVVRNRVETRFRGTTYRDVVLEARQFSAFNDETPRRARILGLTESDPRPDWQRALAVAREVYHAPPAERPFPITTRHFYSPVSMTGRTVPHWAIEETPLHLANVHVDPNRFRFFDGVDEGDRGELSSIRARHDLALEAIRPARRRMRLSGSIPGPVPPSLPVLIRR